MAEVFEEGAAGDEVAGPGAVEEEAAPPEAKETAAGSVGGERLDRFGQGGELQWEIITAATIILTISMIVIFSLGQRYFIEGLTTTGTKG